MQSTPNPEPETKPDLEPPILPDVTARHAPAAAKRAVAEAERLVAICRDRLSAAEGAPVVDALAHEQARLAAAWDVERAEALLARATAYAAAVASPEATHDREAAAQREADAERRAKAAREDEARRRALMEVASHHFMQGFSVVRRGAPLAALTAAARKYAADAGRSPAEVARAIVTFVVRPLHEDAR